MKFQGPGLLVYCSAVTVLKFFTFPLEISFLADPTDYAVGLDEIIDAHVLMLVERPIETLKL